MESISQWRLLIQPPSSPVYLVPSSFAYSAPCPPPRFPPFSHFFAFRFVYSCPHNPVSRFSTILDLCVLLSLRFVSCYCAQTQRAPFWRLRRMMTAKRDRLAVVSTPGVRGSLTSSGTKLHCVSPPGPATTPSNRKNHRVHTSLSVSYRLISSQSSLMVSRH